MKNWTLKIREVDKEIFNAIKKGNKPIETRAATPKYQSIEIGDTLTFVCEGNSISKKVGNKFHWNDVDSMASQIDFKKVMPDVSGVEEMKKVYSSFPGYDEKIKEFGIVGFELI